MTRYDNDQGTRSIYWFFFGILAFAAVLFPLLGANFRYQLGTGLSGFFDIVLSTIGTILITIGSITLLFGVLSLLCGRSSKGVTIMLSGFFFIIIGFFCTGENFLFFLEGSDAPPRPRGYN